MIGEMMTAYESEKETAIFLQQEADDNLSDSLARQRLSNFKFEVEI